MHTLQYYIELLENGYEGQVILDLFDLHKQDYHSYLKIKRQLLEQLHAKDSSDRLVKLALICFILAKLPTLFDVAIAYDHYLPLSDSQEAFIAFCREYPEAHSCRIYDV